MLSVVFSLILITTLSIMANMTFRSLQICHSHTLSAILTILNRHELYDNVVMSVASIFRHLISTLSVMANISRSLQIRRLHTLSVILTILYCHSVGYRDCQLVVLSAISISTLSAMSVLDRNLSAHNTCQIKIDVYFSSVIEQLHVTSIQTIQKLEKPKRLTC